MFEILVEIRLLSWGPCNYLCHQDMFIVNEYSSPQYSARRVILSGILGNNCNSCLYFELHALVLDLFMSILELGVHLAAHVIYVQEMDACML